METNKNKITFLGYNNTVVLTLEIDYNNTLIAKNGIETAIHYCFTTTYFSIKIFGKDGTIRYNYSISGTDASIWLMDILNGIQLEEGDYLNITHREPNRLKIEGLVENAPKDLSINCADVDLDNSYFYPSQNKLLYSNKVLEKTTIIFKGNNNTTALSISFDYALGQFKAIGTATPINSTVGENKYCDFNIYSKKGVLKLGYTLRGNDNTMELANILNNMPYVSNGDYIKIDHVEKDKLFIDGYVENNPFDLSSGCTNLNLSNSLFYIKKNILSYSSKILNMSADKSALFQLINNLKSLDSKLYLRKSYFNLEKDLIKGENLVNTPLVSEEDIALGIAILENSKNTLRRKNRIVFSGVNIKDVGELFLALELETIKNRFKSSVLRGSPIHYNFSGRVYCSVTILNADGEEKMVASVNGEEYGQNLHLQLNNYKYEEGDYIKFYHAEPSRLNIEGYVKNAPYDLSRGCKQIDLNTSFFQLKGDYLIYFNNTAIRNKLRNVISDLIKSDKYINDFNFQQTIVNAQKTLSNDNASIDLIEKEINKLNIYIS